MLESPCAAHIAELAQLLQRLFGLRHRLKVVLPDNIANLKAQLDELRPEGRAGNRADVDLLHRIGMILSPQHEPVTMGELGRALDVPLSTATRIVDWLVRNGYAERQPDVNDRRVVRVALTDTGQAVYQASNAFARHRLETLLRCLTAEECGDLVALMRKLVQALEEEPQEEQDDM
jgi:DNA-binding MarR family transcriptional regulator